jgi:hypothetical protein
MILVDVQSTIPELMSVLASPSYPTISLRLARSFDLLGAFLIYLINSLNDEDTSEASPHLVIPPEYLLKLRTDFSEAFSLLTEYLRDRWDASVAGAQGLHKSAQEPGMAASTEPLPLTWDSPDLPSVKDPITLSGLRALSIWLSEDDGSALRKQAVGLLDMLLALYTLSQDTGNVDFRAPILNILSALFLDSKSAIREFLSQDGWKILASDLQKAPLSDGRALYTQDISNALLLVVESHEVSQSREAWIQVVSWASKFNVMSALDEPNGPTIEEVAGCYELATAIYNKAPGRLQEVYKSDMIKIQKFTDVISSESARPGSSQGK